jgi:hypothetical protein
LKLFSGTIDKPQEAAPNRKNATIVYMIADIPSFYISFALTAIQNSSLCAAAKQSVSREYP